MPSGESVVTLSQQTWRDQGCRATLMRVLPSELTVLVITNGDPHRMLGICVRTPPANCRGASHALEHLVLAGSARFPSPSAFAETLQGSMATYSNAFTRPDHTCFVAASRNLADLRNFAQVYLDGIYCPLLRQDSFDEQIGSWSSGSASEREFRPGVLYNEVLAVYSKPEAVLAERVRASLFPGHHYQYAAGGDPDSVPDLNLAEAVRYHAEYYCPANSFAFISGDLEPETAGELICDAIGSVPAGRSHHLARATVRKPRASNTGVMTARGGPASSHCVVAWALPRTEPEDRALALVVDQLVARAGRQRLEEATAGLGAGAVLGRAGLTPYLERPLFSVAAQGFPVGVRPEQFATAITSAIARIAGEATGPDITTALAAVDFRLRENETGAWPPAMPLFLRALPGWLYEGDIFGHLYPQYELTALLRDPGRALRLVTSLVGDWLVDSPDRVAVGALAEPAPRRPVSSVADQALAAVPSVLAASQVPVLSMDDAAHTQDPPVPSEERQGGLRVLRTVQNRNGICYVDLAFSLTGLTLEQLQSVPAIGAVLADSARESIAQHRSSLFGDPGVLTSMVFVLPGDAGAYLCFRGKASATTGADLADAMVTVCSGNIADASRLHRIVRAQRAQLRRAYTTFPRLLRLRIRTLTAQGRHEEALSGLDQLRYLQDLEQELAQSADSALEQIAPVLAAIRRREAATLSIAGDPGSCPAGLAEALSQALAPLPAQSPQAPALSPPRSTVVHSADAARVLCLNANLTSAGFRITGEHLVLARLIEAHLWERIRRIGRAYATECSADPYTDEFGMMTFRDPQLARSIDVVRQAPRELLKTHLSARQMQSAIVRALAVLDHVGSAHDEAVLILRRWLSGGLDVVRRSRQEVLASQLPSCREVADLLDDVVAQAPVAVMTPDRDEATKLAQVLGCDVESIDRLEARPVAGAR
jgi:presequence protease